MADLEKVIKGLECCSSGNMCKGKCPYDELGCEWTDCVRPLAEDALSLLKEQEPRVMTLEEVVAHYSLPPVFPDDFGMQFDYLNDIQPLYFDFLHSEDPWIVHWRKYDEVNKYLYGWKANYGKTWRCWTSRPTDEQREKVKWNADTSD